MWIWCVISNFNLWKSEWRKLHYNDMSCFGSRIALFVTTHFSLISLYVWRLLRAMPKHMRWCVTPATIAKNARIECTMMDNGISIEASVRIEKWFEENQKSNATLRESWMINPCVFWWRNLTSVRMFVLVGLRDFFLTLASMSFSFFVRVFDEEKERHRNIQ